MTSNPLNFNANSKSEQHLAAEQLLEPQATRIAAWLLWRDRGVLLLLYPVLTIAPLARHLLPQTDAVLLAIIIADRVAELLFLYFVTRRALEAFGVPIRADRLKQALSYIVWGAGLWLLFQAGLMFQLLAESPRSILVSGVCTALGTIFGLRYFFYFLPALAGNFSLRQIGALARCFVRTRPLLGLRALLPAFAWVLFLTGIVTVLSPDGRSLGVSITVDLISGLFFLISTYLSFGIAQAYCDEECWRLLGAQSSLTIAQSDRRKRGNERLLTRSTSLRLLVAASLVWVGNAILDLTSAPAAKIEVLAVEAKDRAATVRLRLSDPQYSLRGLDLNAFTLAGEKRIQVSRKLISSHLASGDEIEAPLESSGPVTVVLEFETDRRAEDLVALEDLYLWYKMKQIEHLKVELEGRAPPRP